MKKIGDLYKELGFRNESSPNAQRAFIKHLVKAAEQASQQNPSPKSEQKEGPIQLSFDPEILKAGNN